MQLCATLAELSSVMLSFLLAYYENQYWRGTLPSAWQAPLLMCPLAQAIWLGTHGAASVGCRQTIELRV